MQRAAGAAFMVAVLASVGVFGMFGASGSEVPDVQVPLCPSTVEVPGLGVVCRRADTLLSVFAPDGSFVGATHGTDPVPAELPDLPLFEQPGTQPTCVDESQQQVEPHTELLYARAHDDLDRYGLKAQAVRNLTRSANGVLAAAAVATGGLAALKVLCAEGQMIVRNETLPTDMADASFATVANDLQAKGYSLPHVKYLVYYDDPGACGCAGAANLWFDDLPGPANLNNGVAPMFAIDFGYDSTLVMLHELSHTMGAVQSSAPHTTGAGHCWDGRDIMCYNDGGPNGGMYTSGICASSVYDCGHDDYFHRNPDPTSYLATHWNLGAPWNRFLHTGPPLDVRLAAPSL